MRVFITGVAGFLGSHIAEAMLRSGHAVVGVDDLSGGDVLNIPSADDGWDISWHRDDCCDVDLMREYSKGCDLVYHCAAHAHEGLSVFSPSYIVHNIVSASTAVFSAAIANRVKRIVFCSSMARYGESFGSDFSEGRECRPVDPYGIAKKAAEDILSMLCNEHGVEYAIAVPHNVIGPRQKYDDPFRNVASIMANQMLKGLAVAVYGDGRQVRCFSDVRDCVGCLVEMGTRASAASQVVNIGPDNSPITINELLTRLQFLIGWDGHVVHFPERPGEVKIAVCRSDKARVLLDFHQRFSLDESLRSIVDHIKERGPKPFKYHIPLEIVTERTPRTWSERLF